MTFSRPHGYLAISDIPTDEASISEYLNSFGNENGFNDIRDNERRGAKHSQRSDATLQSLAISSMATRWAASEEEYRPTLIQVEAEDVSSSTHVHVAPDTFRASGTKPKEDMLGFDPKEISDPQVTWPSTSTDRFTWSEVFTVRGRGRTKFRAARRALAGRRTGLDLAVGAGLDRLSPGIDAIGCALARNAAQ